MSISGLRDEIQKALANFLWDEWGQMGVSASTSRRDSWATDPEALLLLTFEVGRDEPRLFEEVLDWMLVNERLLSVQRLRNLARDDEDQALVEAAIGWLGQSRSRQRLKARPGGGADPQPFFRDSRLRTADPDPAFLTQGFLKPRSEPSAKSRTPDVRLPRMNVQTLAESMAYTKRNVQETLTSLTIDGFVDLVGVHNENRYAITRARWASFLQLDPLPSSIDWLQVSRAFRMILRWLVDPTNQDLSEYMLMSNARTMVEAIEPDLRFAGLSLRPADWTRDPPSFEGFLRELSRNVLSVDL